MTTTATRTTAALLGALALAGAGRADGDAKPVPPPPTVIPFGSLKPPAVETVKADALRWLETAGKLDAAGKARFDELWAGERTVLDKLAETFAMADTPAVKLLAEAKGAQYGAPKELPAFVREAASGFFRSNYALLYARALSNKRVYEEALEALKVAVPEEVADPAAYYFTRAVAEHALAQKRDALTSINRLLDDVAGAPERYKMVSALMFLDMQGWKDDDKDLQNIARLMDNIERRLDLARHGKKTQDLQKKVVFRLDEMIKEVENQVKNQGQPQPCPAGGPPQQGNTNQPSSPQQDSIGGQNSGPGNVDQKKLQQLAQNWGKLPEKERAKAMMELTKDLPPKYREVIENYFKTLARSQEQK